MKMVNPGFEDNLGRGKKHDSTRDKKAGVVKKPGSEGIQETPGSGVPSIVKAAIETIEIYSPRLGNSKDEKLNLRARWDAVNDIYGFIEKEVRIDAETEKMVRGALEKASNDENSVIGQIASEALKALDAKKKIRL